MIQMNIHQPEYPLREQPDVICFQEVLPHVAVWLKESLWDYYVIGCGRSAALEDEQMAVAYRKDRLNLIQIALGNSAGFSTFAKTCRSPRSLASACS